MVPIHVISPVVETPSIGFTEEATAAQLAPFVDVQGVELLSVFLDQGPSSIEDAIDHALCVPDLLRKAMVAEREGSAGILIDCMYDPGLDVLKHALAIPVVGVGETANRHAAGLGGRFGILGAADGAGETIVRAQLMQAGLNEACAGFRSAPIPVEAIDGCEDLAAVLLPPAIEAVERDGAGALVLGCTGFIGHAAVLEEALAARGLRVPVIDPLPLAVGTLARIALQGGQAGSATPRKPAAKRLAGYPADDPLNALYS